MRSRTTLTAIALSAAALAALATLAAAAPANAANLELYGTFHSMGVIVHLQSGEDPDGDASVSIEYRELGSGPFQAGHPLSRPALGRFAGSLFFLTPGQSYDVRATISEPDGGPLDGLVLTGSLATRPDVVVPPSIGSRVASPSGSGSACTLPSPCSLRTAVQQAAVGDEVLLRGGVYHDGGISIPRSGVQGAPIVIRSYPGESAVLDGADPSDYSWAASGGGVWHTAIPMSQPEVFAGGQRLYPYKSLGDLQSLRWGVPGYFASGSTLYVRLAGDADPNATRVDISAHQVGFSVGRDHIYFVDLTLRHYGRGGYSKAIYFDGASFNLVQGCRFELNEVGVGMKRDCHQNVIQDSEFIDDSNAWPWNAFKQSGLMEATALTMFAPMTGRGTVFRRNIVRGGFDGIGCAPAAGGPAGSNETDVYENLVYDLGDDGVTTDGVATNVRIWSNTFHHLLVGVSLAPNYNGPTYAVGNLVYLTNTGSSPYVGTPFKFNSGDNGSGPMFLYHNTVDTVTPGEHAMHIQSPGSWSQLVTRNNIWSATSYALRNRHAGQPADFDWDCLYTTYPNRLAWWDGLSDKSAESLGELQSATGQELNGIHANPEFVNAAAADYRLSPSSPLIDRGVHIPGINDGFSGAAPDIGAFEAGGTPACASLAASVDNQPAANVCLNSAVELDGQMTGGDPAAFTYSWDLDGDGNFDLVGLPSPRQTRTYTRPGTFHAVLKADGPCTVESTVTITVGPDLTALVNWKRSDQVCTGARVELDGYLMGETGSYTYSWDLDGDGNFDLTGLPSPRLTRTYTNPGTFRAVLRAEGACTVESTVTIDVGGGSVDGLVNWKQSDSVCVGSPVELDGWLNAGPGSFTYSWDLDGDGVFDVTGLSSPRLTRTYTRPGTFDAVLRAEGGACTLEDTVTIQVGPTLVALVNWRKADTVCVGEQVELDGRLNGAAGPYTYSWDLDGDGVFDLTGLPTPRLTRTYTRPGNFQAVLRAEGACTVDDSVLIDAVTQCQTPQTVEAKALSYLGDSAYDQLGDIAVDAAGNLYLTGITGSNNFPVTSSALQPTPGAGRDGFALVIAASFSSPIYASFVGGNGDDKGRGLAVAPGGTMIVGGESESSNLALVDPIQGVNRGQGDVFFARIDVPLP